MKKLTYFMSFVLAVVLLFACSSSGPKWAKGKIDKSGKEVYGVGRAEGINSETLRRTAADNRALAELSKNISAVSSSLMNDYLSSASASAQEKNLGQQYVENTIKTVTSNTINGAKIVDRWDNGTVAYSLAMLSAQDLKDNINRSKISSDMKNFMNRNAEKAFEELNQEVEYR